MRRSTLAVGSALVLIVGSSLVGSTASATPPSGPATVVTPGPSPALQGQVGPFVATLAGPVKAKSNGISFKTKADTVVRNFFLTYPAGSSSGWHKHPGLVFATVASGSVVRTLGCGAPETFTAGQAFVESGVHLVQNTGGTDATLIITQIVEQGTTGAAFREDEPAPTCHPRT